MDISKQEVKHTPTPWFAQRQGSSTVYIESRIRPGTLQEVAACGPTEAGSEQQDANAEFIVRACNAHEQLVAALRDLEVAANSLQYCFDRRPENFGVALTQLTADAQRARAVLAQATGEQA